jgi:hypothetical protein
VNTIASIRLAQKPIDDQKGAPSSSLSSEGRENNYDYYDSGGCRFLKEDIKMELDEESESAATAASSESDSSWSSSELDDDDSDSDNEEAEGENLDSGGTLRRRRRIGLRNQQKRRRYENPTPPRYTAVQLDLSVAGDLRKLKEVLCRFYGRLPLNRKAAAEAETSSSLKTL